MSTERAEVDDTGVETSGSDSAMGGIVSIHLPSERLGSILVLGLTGALLACIYPLLAKSSHQGSPDFHATIELVGSLLGLIAGFALIACFAAQGNRFHLLVGLAFFVNGAEDFAHGLLSFPYMHQMIGLPAASLARFIPGTYASGRVLMGGLLLLAPFVPAWFGTSHRPRREAVWICLLVLGAAVVVTVLAFGLPLPRFVFPHRVISRPVDFVSVPLFVLALGAVVHAYWRDGDMLTWWIALSIVVNVVGQLMMSFSKALHDPFFDVAHIYKVLGYVTPLIGFCLHQITILSEHMRVAEQMTHLNAVLRATRSVNQIIKQEEDRDRLLQRCCDNLIATGGYVDACIALVDRNGKFVSLVAAGLGNTFDQVQGMLQRGGWPRCAEMALTQGDMTVVEDVANTCRDCPLGEVCPKLATIAVRIERARRVYGILAVTLPKNVAVIADEELLAAVLVAGVAGDIAFALGHMEVESEREQAEDALQRVHDGLERRVEERTADLSEANEALRAEIADRERAEQDLRDSEERYRMLVETMNEGLAALDADGLFTYCNPRFCELIGYPPDEVVGRPIAHFVDEANQKVLADQLARRRKGEDKPYELVWTSKDGRKVESIISPRPILAADGQYEGSFAVVTDITGHKQGDGPASWTVDR